MASLASGTIAISDFALDSPVAISKLTAVLEKSDTFARSAIAQEIHNLIANTLGSTPAPRWSPPRESGVLAHVADLMKFLPSAVVVHGLVVQLSMDQDGCHLLQSALEASNGAERAAIAVEFYGHVCDALESPHAHHVLQRIVELMPPSSVCFILRELQTKWSPAFLARHRFGCRVLERIIEHFPACPQAGPELVYFLEGITQNAAPHCHHAFATFVMQHILEYGTVEQQRAIVKSLSTDLWRTALDMHAVGALDKALTFQPFEDQRALATAILNEDGLLTRMALTRKGLPVARRLLRVVDGVNLEEARRQLSGDAAKLARSKGGKALLSAAKLGDISTTVECLASPKTGGAPRQELMLDKVIIPQHSELDQEELPGGSTFFATVKNADPFVPAAQLTMQPFAVTHWSLLQADEGHFSAPDQQQMVQSDFSNDQAEPWWAATVTEVRSLWCQSCPEEPSQIHGANMILD